MKIGITGQNGFIGYHLFQTIKYIYSDYSLVPFQKSFFENEKVLAAFVSSCDVIVHLAGVNRAETEEEVYHANMKLNSVLNKALIEAKFNGHLLFASSSQENGDSLYGKAKKEARVLLEGTIHSLGGKFSGLIIPNIFGPFCKPNYNSFVATFCVKIINDKETKIIQDANVPLLYVGNLVEQILQVIEEPKVALVELQPDIVLKVSQVLSLLETFKKDYLDSNTIPSLQTPFELQLFNTFRSYIDMDQINPVPIVAHTDERGFFF